MTLKLFAQTRYLWTLGSSADKALATVLQLDDNGLLLHRIIDPIHQHLLISLAPVRAIWLTPYCQRAHVKRWQQLLPKLRFFCAPQYRRNWQPIIADIADYQALPADQHLRVELLAGLSPAPLVLVLNHNAKSQSLLFDDAVEKSQFWQRLLTFSPPTVLCLRRKIWQDRHALALSAHLTFLAQEKPLVRLIAACGNIITDNPGQALIYLALKLRKNRKNTLKQHF